MISFLKGILEDIEKDKAVFDVNGVGYGVFMPESDLQRLNRTGKALKIYTYLSVKEDAMQLYGFLSKDSLNIFKLLIMVNGIGPKVALGVLSAITPDELRIAVLSDDLKKITSAPGIGRKTAQKLILELKDKLSIEDTVESFFEQNATETVSSNSVLLDHQNEAAMALIALGYQNSDAYKAVKKVEATEDMTVEDILKQALRFMMF